MKSIDLTGQSFGELTVIEEDLSVKDKRKHWTCKCSCGSKISVRSNSLRTGNTSSCGCSRLRSLVEMSTKHGESNSKLYEIWQNMKQRCDNPKKSFYKDYGGRGITYQDSWSNFESFFNDLIGGYKEGLSLERVDVNGNYCKDNCSWIDVKDQAKNRRKPKNNTSGFTGVDTYFNKSGTMYYRVRWVEHGKNMSKYFSTKKFEDAYETACTFRENVLRSLDYGIKHGL